MVFLIVCRKMLDRRSYAFLLDTLNMSLRHLTGKIRVLRKIFKVSAAQRGTFDIHRRSKQNRNIFRLAFFSKGRSHLLQQIAVKEHAVAQAVGKHTALILSLIPR